jgi:thermolabile hemolysin
MRMRSIFPICLFACTLLAGCTATSQPPTGSDHTWLVHCETDKSYTPDLVAVPGIYDGRWLWAEHATGEKIYLQGSLKSGFFHLQGAVSGSGEALPGDEKALRQFCIGTIARDEPRDLARVMAARDSRDLDIPIIYPDEDQDPDKVTRLVVFGDSLSDAGRLKHRMQVFPGKPYWLGRFSNGPVWPDYLESATSLAIQNRSYGGASVDKPLDFHEAGLIAFIKDEGRFFVSGSLAEQVTEFLEDSSLPGQVTDPGKTAFLIWAGANDYISKEPFTGLITTFLNTARDELGYKSVADDTVAGLLAQIEVLYKAGARKFILLNLPDLGRSPIVLQNESYTASSGIDSDTGRRVELSRRLSALSDYHNRQLQEAVEKLKVKQADSQILLVDSRALTDDVLSSRLFNDNGLDFDYGFSLAALHEEIGYEGRLISLQQACYSGAYLGTLDDGDICDFAKTAFFWDVIHPGTYAQCWQAYQVNEVMAQAGWIKPPLDPASYRQWCDAQTNRLIE